MVTIPVSNVLNIKDSRLVDAWGNILKKGGAVTEHTHGPAVISGILYLTEGGPGTYFREFNKTVEEKIGKKIPQHLINDENFDCIDMIITTINKI